MYRARLPAKPGVELTYSISYTPANANPLDPNSPHLIIFLNNLLMPAASWETPIQILNSTRNPSQHPKIPIITYDRFGQGQTTDHDPNDSLPGAEPGYGHDFTDVVSDLHSLIHSTLLPTLYPSLTPSTPPSLLLIGASIGAPLARLYAQTYPRTVSGLILLDSNIANANYNALFPDPASPDFNPKDVIADDCTLEQYLHARAALCKMFDLDVKNREHLDRRNTPLLLPCADRPVLYGPGGVKTKVLVVGHDPGTFADEGLERMGTPRSVTRRWVQGAWEGYNEGLLGVGEAVGDGEVRIARGCGHFIQRDDAGFVAGVVSEILDVLGW